MKINHQLLLSVVLGSLFTSINPVFAQTAAVTYQGSVQDNGTNFTGAGLFKFALITRTNNATNTFWSNDGTSIAGRQPADAVTNGVTNGLFTIVLGDATVSNMTVISNSVFAQPNLQLQIWFSDGVNGFAALSPPQNLTPAPYAVTAAQLSAAIPLAQLPNSVLTNNASGAVLNGVFTGDGGSLTNLESAAGKPVVDSTITNGLMAQTGGSGTNTSLVTPAIIGGTSISTAATLGGFWKAAGPGNRFEINGAGADAIYFGQDYGYTGPFAVDFIANQVGFFGNQPTSGFEKLFVGSYAPGDQDDKITWTGYNPWGVIAGDGSQYVGKASPNGAFTPGYLIYNVTNAAGGFTLPDTNYGNTWSVINYYGASGGNIVLPSATNWVIQEQYSPIYNGSNSTFFYITASNAVNISTAANDPIYTNALGGATNVTLLAGDTIGLYVSQMTNIVAFIQPSSALMNIQAANIKGLGTAAQSNATQFQQANVNLTGWAILPTNIIGTAAQSNATQFQPANASLSGYASIPTNTFMKATNGVGSNDTLYDFQLNSSWNGGRIIGPVSIQLTNEVNFNISHNNEVSFTQTESPKKQLLNFYTDQTSFWGSGNTSGFEKVFIGSYSPGDEDDKITWTGYNPWGSAAADGSQYVGKASPNGAFTPGYLIYNVTNAAGGFTLPDTNYGNTWSVINYYGASGGNIVLPSATNWVIQEQYSPIYNGSNSTFFYITASNAVNISTAANDPIYTNTLGGATNVTLLAGDTIGLYVSQMTNIVAFIQPSSALLNLQAANIKGLTNVGLMASTNGYGANETFTSSVEVSPKLTNATGGAGGATLTSGGIIITGTNSSTNGLATITFTITLSQNGSNMTTAASNVFRNLFNGLMAITNGYGTNQSITNPAITGAGFTGSGYPLASMEGFFGVSNQLNFGSIGANSRLTWSQDDPTTQGRMFFFVNEPWFKGAQATSGFEKATFGSYAPGDEDDKFTWTGYNPWGSGAADGSQYVGKASPNGAFTPGYLIYNVTNAAGSFTLPDTNYGNTWSVINYYGAPGGNIVLPSATNWVIQEQYSPIYNGSNSTFFYITASNAVNISTAANDPIYTNALGGATNVTLLAGDTIGLYVSQMTNIVAFIQPSSALRNIQAKGITGAITGVSPISINASGVTNTSANYGTAVVYANNATFTNFDAAGNSLMTNGPLTGTNTFWMGPGSYIKAASGLGGRIIFQSP